jgi:hypothetical protein
MITFALMPYKIWTGHVERTGERRGAYKVLVRKPEGKRSFGIPKRKWRIKLKCIFRTWGGGMDWIDLAQDRDRWRADVHSMNISSSIKCG